MMPRNKNDCSNNQKNLKTIWSNYLTNPNILPTTFRRQYIKIWPQRFTDTHRSTFEIASRIQPKLVISLLELSALPHND